MKTKNPQLIRKGKALLPNSNSFNRAQHGRKIGPYNSLKSPFIHPQLAQIGCVMFPAEHATSVFTSIRILSPGRPLLNDLAKGQVQTF